MCRNAFDRATLDVVRPDSCQPPRARVTETPPHSASEQSAEPAAHDRTAVSLGALVTLTCIVSGFIAVPAVAQYNLQTLSIFYEQFARIEPPALLLLALFAVVVLILALRSGSTNVSTTQVECDGREEAASGRGRAILLAIGVFLVTVLGTDLIFHRFFFADDEYSAYFQALIFARGQWSAIVAPEWCRWIGYLTPTSIAQSQPCTWHLSYLPIHSMVRALFIAIHADRFAGPVMAAITVLLVGATARRVWPDRPRRAWIAMAVLATSTQFLLMSMTMYAMPTHLLFASVWLWLYVVDRPWSIVLLPIVGFIALGVHSPIPHGLLVPVFWFRYVRQRRFGAAAYIAAVYAVALVFWWVQLEGLAVAGSTVTANTVATASTAVSMFHVPSILNLYTSAMNMSLLASWNTPLALICAVAAGVAWHQLETFERDAALTLLFVIVARVLSNSLQGEGWGYRFIYAALGIFALVAARGVDVLAGVLGARRTNGLLVASFAASVVVQLPMRGIQAEWIIRPYYEAYNLLSHQTAKIVVFRSADFLWARQLLRNDPFLEKKPLLMSMYIPSESVIPAACTQPDAPTEGVTIAAAREIRRRAVCARLRAKLDSAERPFRELMQTYPGQVRVVSREELVATGLVPFVPPPLRLQSDSGPSSGNPK